MEINEILRSVVENQVNGLMFHSQMMAYFDFLGLNGFADVQRCRYESEGKEMLQFRRFYVQMFDAVSDTGDVNTNNDVVPAQWKELGYRRRFDISGLASGVKFAFERWVDWEEHSLNVYGKARYYCDEIRCAEASLKVDELVKDTERELRYVKDLAFKLRNVDWDSYTVLLMQKDSVKEYKKWMKLDRKENKE